MTTYEITKIRGRDGIRTRKNRDVAFASLEIRVDGREVSLSVQTRAGDLAVFRADVDRSGAGTLHAMTPEAVEVVDAAIEADRARLQHLADLDAALEIEFGSIAIGSPRQIIYARKSRVSVADRVRDFMSRLPDYCDGAPAGLEDELRQMIPRLYPVAAFWIEAAGDLSSSIRYWHDNRDSINTPIGRARAEAGL